MRIAIDATPLMKAERSGVGQYLTSLLGGLAAVAPVEDFLLCYRLSRFSRRAHRLPLPGPRFRQRWIQGGYRPFRMDVAHGPDARVLPWRGTARVVTLHDLFSLLSDDFATESFRMKKRRRYDEIVRSAHRVISVSTWTRDTFLEHFPGFPPERIVVVPLGVERRFRPVPGEAVAGIRRRHGIEGPYFVFVGMLSERKNVRALIDAFAGLPADAPRLVLAGPPGRGHEDLPADLARRGLEARVTLTGFFPQVDLPALYTGAEALVFPSRLEGFGLPILEAMACGTPVITSDRGALAETAGGIRIAVDPDDPDSIREGMRRLLSDGALRTELAGRGIEHARQFTWEDVARRTLETYRAAIRDAEE